MIEFVCIQCREHSSINTFQIQLKLCKGKLVVLLFNFIHITTVTYESSKSNETILYDRLD